MKFYLQLTLIILVCSISGCKKEKLISINPFGSMGMPEVVVGNQTAKFTVQLADYSYDEVGVSYGLNKTDLAMGTMKNTLLLQKNGKEYSGLLSAFDETEILYYRVYAKLKGETVLSSIYEIIPRKYSLIRKDSSKWVIPDAQSRFTVVLLGENIDDDIKQYTVTDDNVINLAVIKVIKNESGTGEIHLSGQVSPMRNNQYIGFTLLYKNKPIFTDIQIKIAQPKGYGHYTLKRINGNPNTGNIGFQYNNELYTIGNGMIQKYYFNNNMWFREKAIDPRFGFYNETAFNLGDTFFFTGSIQDDRLYIDFENKQVRIVSLDIKNLNTKEEYITLDKIFPSYRDQALINYYELGGKMIAILTVTDSETYENHKFLYSIDWESRQGKFVGKIDSKIKGKIFEYNGKAYWFYHIQNGAGEFFYTLSEFNPKTAELKPLKSFPELKTYFFHFSVHNNDLIMVGRDRVIARLNLKDFSVTSYEQFYNTYPFDVLDHEEWAGHVFYVNNKYYFGRGAFSEGLFEFSFVDYE